ncbi:thiamine pyrophosphate-dependent dehydrogenase E1 component subunit alpha [Brevibacillus fulvus]|uniref:2-oxoisovalerate dehydrogenase subunit alpha n=1 Tax=Brevibacillus fulvus TaxID=1125967 RepID=A0A938XV17_9BACL|nr:thiamine pyrophosphate-dependent dehydrogenase E1 component subunit alpha [Brevibacillus fulvus]MBM7588609.1 2-oxoisovalerate dehydrogenase E1 component alpha subunit [Brevibacillus fulvus]
MMVNRHKEVGLTDEQVLDMYYYMLLARKIDERQWLLNRAGKVPFVVSCQGQEAAQVGAAFAFEKGNDYSCPYYRDLGFVLVMGQTPRDCMLSVFAKAEEPNSGGRQMPGHFGSRKLNMLSGSSPVTTQVPHAVGIALAGRMQGKNHVVYTSFGEGSSNQGDFHEGANFAGVHKLPVIFFCENNQYAISVPLKKQLGGKVADRAIGYGFKGITVDGNDPIETYRVVKEAVDRARAGEGPTLIEAIMYRLVPHSSDDDDRTYRSREEVEEAKRRDPVPAFAAYLREVGVMDEAKEAEINQRVQQEVDDATEYAENAPYPDPASLYQHVYGESKEV